MIYALWRYRAFIFSSAKREFNSRYLGSKIGFVWSLIHPLVLILIYTLVFSEIMRARLPGLDDKLAFGIYLCAGVLTWNLFSEIITRSQTIFFENASLLKKSSIPRICFPAILLVSAAMNFLVVFSVFLAFLVVTGRFPGIVVLSCIPLLAIQSALSVGIGIIAGTFNVFIRDVGQVIGVLMPFWFWLTPIVYPISILPEYVREWLYLNPMVAVIEGYQRIFVQGAQPAWTSLAPALILGITTFALAVLVFRKHSDELVDEL
ncbi:MAG: ABC transporter permease [Betaproteobacteria bacterium]|nr:ABC transporter permease [Betaproteobacteria bacterium]